MPTDTRNKKNITVADLYDLMTTFINEKAATKEDVTGLATTDDIEALEGRMNVKFTAMENDIKSLGDLRTSLSENVAETMQLKERVEFLENEHAKRVKDEVKRELYDRRLNAIAFGIPEKSKESKDDCVDEIRILLINAGVRNAENITIVDCHRLGKPNDSRSAARPIIFKVNSMFVISDIFQRAKFFKDAGLDHVYIRRHLPKSMRDQRDELKGTMKRLYDAGLKPKWVLDYNTYTYYIVDKNNKTYKR